MNKLYFAFYLSVISITGKQKSVDEKFIRSLKTNNVLLDEGKENGIREYLENNINVNNAPLLYHSSNLYKLSGCSKLSLSFIERCFPMVAESNNFLELEFKYVLRVLSSDELNCDSELQVFNAANGWLYHNISERRKYAKHIFRCIRVFLLSIPAMKYVRDKISLSNHESDVTIEKYLVNNEYLQSKKHTTTWSRMPNMIERRIRHKSVAVKNKLFVFGGLLTTCEMYDSTCNEFVALKSPPSSFLNHLHYPAGVITIGSKLLVFGDGRNILFYDTVNFEWSEESCEAIADVEWYSCAKFPKL